MRRKPKGDFDVDMLPPKKKGPKKWSVFSIRIDEELAKSLNDIAEESGHTRNHVIGRFLEFARIAYMSQKVPTFANHKGRKTNGDKDE